MRTVYAGVRNLRIDPKPRGAGEVRLLDAPGAGYGCAVIRPGRPLRLRAGD